MLIFEENFIISLVFFLVSLINVNDYQSLLMKIRFAAKSADTNM